MKKTAFIKRILAMCLGLALLVSYVPVWASDAGVQVSTTPYERFCGATIRLDEKDYLCAVDLGSPVIDSASGTELTAGSTLRFDLFFFINDGWYACRKQEMQGNPNDLFTVRVTGYKGSERISNPVWKTYSDDGYGERYYLEITVTGGETATPLDISVALTQPEAGNVGADYRITGTSAAYGVCTAGFSLPGYNGPCDVYFGDPVTSTGDSAAMVPGSTVCYPLMFMGGDGKLYAALRTELQGNPETLFEVEQSESSLLTKTGWKTWENGHWYLEYTVGQGNPSDELNQQVRLWQRAAYKASPAKGFRGTMGEKGLCVAPISIGGTVYDCVVDLQGYLTSSGNEQNMTADSTICFPLMFMGGDGQWYPVLAGELQGNPAVLFSQSETFVSGKALLTNKGWKTWDNGHYYLEYSVADSQYETELNFSVQLKQDEKYRQGNKVTFLGKAPQSDNPFWTSCCVPISIDGTVFDCIVDFHGYLTSSGNNTLPGGGTVAFPLMFLGGDGVWYPVLKNELQGDPAILLNVAESITAGEGMLKQTGWGCWENGHYYLEYKVSKVGKDTPVSFAIQPQQGSDRAGSWIEFTGKILEEKVPDEPMPEKPTQCVAPIKIDGTVYDCIVDLQGSLTSSGSSTLDGGGTVAFPLMFLGGDGAWYPVLKDELQGDPAELFSHTLKLGTSGELLTCSGWDYWENGHYYLEYKVAPPKETVQLAFSVTLKTKDGNGEEDRFSGIVYPGPDIGSWQIPLKPSASLLVERLEECKDFNTMSFTINGVRYNDGWPIDFESPNTASAVITNGTIIRVDLCFRVNEQWYPVRQQECNESVEDLFTYDYQVLSGNEFMGTPRFTTRYDAYGDIWQFEVPVDSEEEGEFCFTLQLVAKDGSKTGSKYKVTGRVQNSEMVSTVEELPKTDNTDWLWVGACGLAAVAATAVVIALTKKKKGQTTD